MSDKINIQTALVGTCPHISPILKYAKPLSAKDRHTILKTREECIQWQENLGLDIISESEVARSHYVRYFLNFLNGIDLDLENKQAISLKFNNSDNKIKLLTPEFINEDYYDTRLFTNKPIKINLPSPGSCCRVLEVFGQFTQANMDLLGEYIIDCASALKEQIMSLIDCGVDYIQIDDPYFFTERNAWFKKINNMPLMHYLLQDIININKKNTKFILHTCLFNPYKIDRVYSKRQQENAYFLGEYKETLDNLIGFDYVHVEKPNVDNNHRFYTQSIKQNIMFGLLDIATDEIENEQDIINDINILLKERTTQQDFIIGPDCGMRGVPIDAATAKIINMVNAVNHIRHHHA